MRTGPATVATNTTNKNIISIVLTKYLLVKYYFITIYDNKIRIVTDLEQLHR
jgi:hypothetical protein